MATIHKKTWRDYFEKVLSGEKTFDVRLADFDISPGDTLVLDEWDDQKQVYTGRTITTTVGYVLQTKNIDFWPPEKIEKYGYQVIQLQQPEKPIT